VAVTARSGQEPPAGGGGASAPDASCAIDRFGPTPIRHRGACRGVDATARVILDAAQPAEGPMISISLIRTPELSLRLARHAC
jgi:hypothetical protein